MNKKQLFFGFLVAVMMASCATKHYQVTGVERTRIIVDSRYDQGQNESLVAFLAPYKRVNDSIMGPELGQVAHNMHPQRPEISWFGLLKTIMSSLCWESTTWEVSVQTLRKV